MSPRLVLSHQAEPSHLTGGALDCNGGHNTARKVSPQANRLSRSILTRRMRATPSERCVQIGHGVSGFVGQNTEKHSTLPKMTCSSRFQQRAFSGSFLQPGIICSHTNRRHVSALGQPWSTPEAGQHRSTPAAGQHGFRWGDSGDHRRQTQRQRPHPSRCNASLDEPSLEGGDLQSVMELPCLPFNPAEVLVPASTKTLHLYEARYLSLLDEAMNKTQGLFAHIILEPVRAEGTEMSFVASHCCLCFIESVRRLEIGALVAVRGVSRLRLLTLTQMEPFLKGSVTAQPDQEQSSPEQAQQLETKLEEVKDLVRDVQRLQIRLKSPGDSPLLTSLEESVQWAEKALSGKIPSFTPTSPMSSTSLSKDILSVPIATPPWPSQTSSLGSFLPSRPELVAFAALQPVAAASPAELHKLLHKRLQAMETLDSFARLEVCKAYAEESRASLAAKLALQNLSM